MGVIALALFASGRITTFYVPLWVKFACALAMASVRYSGGWCIIHTMGAKVIRLDPIDGIVADQPASVSPAVDEARLPGVYHAHHHLGHHGRGSTQRLSPVRWGVAGNIVVAWVLTMPAAALVSGLLYLAGARLF